MSLFSSSYDAKAGHSVYRVAPGFGHSLLAVATADAFRRLAVSAFVYQPSGGWWRLHSEPNLIPFEVEHGQNAERHAYNDRCVAEVRRRKKSVRGEHAGYMDFFVPVVTRGQVEAILVSGPCAPSRPTAAEVVERFRQITGRQGHLADREFYSYLTTSLGLLVLDRGKAASYERLLECLAGLLSGEGDAEALVNEAEVMKAKLEPSRSVERVWDAVRTMLDDRTQTSWSSRDHAWQLRHQLRLSRVPDHVLVGLTTRSSGGLDPLEEFVQRDAFQRAAVELAHRTHDVVAGRVGDHGVVFLLVTGRGAVQKQERVLELVERASALGRRRFGLTLHFGASPVSRSRPLSRSYGTALALAEQALARGVRMTIAEPGTNTRQHSLRQMRQELARSLAESSSALSPRFDRYLEAVRADCGDRLDAVRAQLEAGLEAMALPLVGKGTLEGKSFWALCEELDRAAGEATSSAELFAAYRAAVADVQQAMQQPVPARRERNLRLALDYLRQHYSEPLSFERVARLAGFAPSYFSTLFKAREGMTFERYVTELRIEKAMQALSSTTLGVTKVAEACGFNSPQYFCRVFRRLVGATPLQYRAQPAKYRRQKPGRRFARAK